MPLEIPRPFLKRSATRTPAIMGQLESRTLFAASPSVIHVGPTEAIKTLDAVPWPTRSQTSKSLTVLIDPSSKPYHAGHFAIFGNVTIEAADPNKRPTLQLDATNYPTFFANQKLTIKNLNTVGGYKVILSGSSKTATLDVENNKLLDGGAVWRGQGCVSAYFKNNESYGVPYDYNYGNFNFIAQKVVIDNSGTNVPVAQGVKEAAIRIMDCNNLTMIGVKTKPHFNGTGILKQDIQLRPSSKNMTLINCNFYIADVGDMTWRKPAQPIDTVVFQNCTMVKMPHLTAGINHVRLVNCKVGGKTVTTTLK